MIVGQEGGEAVSGRDEGIGQNKRRFGMIRVDLEHAL